MMSWCFSSPSQPSSSSLSSPPPSPVSFTFPLLPFLVPRAIVVDGVSVRHDQHFAHLFSLRNNVVLRTRKVSNDVAAIIHHPTPFQVREVVSEMKAKKEELKVKKQLLGLVGTVVALNYRLESVRE
ncbi:hypothetical protein ACSQ67_025784 [Phaseolus vulgaris]